MGEPYTEKPNKKFYVTLSIGPIWNLQVKSTVRLVAAEGVNAVFFAFRDNYECKM